CRLPSSRGTSRSRTRKRGGLPRALPAWASLDFSFRSLPAISYIRPRPLENLSVFPAWPPASFAPLQDPRPRPRLQISKFYASVPPKRMGQPNEGNRRYSLDGFYARRAGKDSL